MIYSILCNINFNIFKAPSLKIYAEAYLEHCQIPMVEILVKTTIFDKKLNHICLIGS